MSELFGFADAETIAAAAQISVRCMRKAISKALSGIPWRGCKLDVRPFRGVGGRSGVCHKVLIGSLPAAVRESLTPSIQTEMPLIVLSDGSKGWKLRLIQPVVAAGPAGSSARADAVRRVASSATYPDGKRKGQRISERTFRSWVAAYDKKGALAAERARRADKGKARTVTWRLLDRIMDERGLTTEQQTKIKDEIVLEVKTLLISGAGTVSNVNMIAQPQLRDILLAAIPDLTRPQLDKICRMPAGFVRGYYRVRRAHQKRTDAKGFSDKVTCRTRRHRDDLLPMQMVAFDVRHSDIMYRRKDGSLATAKMIVALDLATNRIFSRIFLMEKGDMIRREHVLMFMRDMFSDPSWGIPLSIYLDNGSEFQVGCAANELAAIAQFVRDAHSIEMGIFDAGQLAKTGILRALPYNGQSKVIEGVFSNLTRSIERMYPGFVGGNRMAPKTENQGREKKPMAGDEDELITKYAEMVSYYNAKRQQRGHIKGRSPNEAFTTFVGNGWQSVVCLQAEFSLAFGKEEYRQVQTGGEFNFGGQVYCHDDLVDREGERIRIRVPILDAGGRIPVLDDKGNVLCVATGAARYGMRDLAGAREKGRRNGVLHQKIKSETAGVPTVDLSPRIARAVAELGAPPVPTPLATVSVSPALREAAVAPFQPVEALPDKPSPLMRLGQFAQSQNEKMRRAG